MEESVDLHEEAGKENEQTLAKLSPVTDESQLNAWARKGKQIKLFMFLFSVLLRHGHIINILLTELGRLIRAKYFSDALFIRLKLNH